MKTLLIVNRVWDQVTGTQVRPNPAPAAIVVARAAHANQAEITSANKKLTEFEDAYLRASCLVAAAVLDTEILAVTSVLEDPVATWAALSRKYARKSKMEAGVAHMALLQVQHIETETANETITRYQASMERCAQQGVTTYAQLLE